MSQIANSIKGSLSVITGCNSGLGKATLKRFLEHGCGPVLAIDRKFHDHFIDSLRLDKEQASKITLSHHDTFDEAKTSSSLEQFAAKHGPIDNLVNVAGVALAFQFFNDSCDGQPKAYDMKHSNDLLRFNTLGTFNMIRTAAQYMINPSGSPPMDRSRCIIMTSCISTTKPCFGQTFYSASMSAIDSMTLCVAREFAPVNIRCNTINVGYFDTPLIGNDDLMRVYLPSEVIQCPKRLGDPDEFAHLVQSIIENKMLNGACIKIDACTEPGQELPHSKRYAVNNLKTH